MFGSNNGTIIVFLVLDMIFTIGVVFFILSRRNSRGGTTKKSTDFNSVPPSPFGTPSSSSTASIDDIKDLLQRGQKIQAIKLYRELNPTAGLKDAKDAVEEMERSGDFSGASSFESPFSTSTASGSDGSVEDLLRRGQKLEAIKLYREQNPPCGLKEAKDAVESIQRQMGV